MSQKNPGGRQEEHAWVWGEVVTGRTCRKPLGTQAKRITEALAKIREQWDWKDLFSRIRGLRYRCFPWERKPDELDLGLSVSHSECVQCFLSIRCSPFKTLSRGGLLNATAPSSNASLSTCQTFQVGLKWLQTSFLFYQSPHPLLELVTYSLACYGMKGRLLLEQRSSLPVFHQLTQLPQPSALGRSQTSGHHVV